MLKNAISDGCMYLSLRHPSQTAFFQFTFGYEVAILALVANFVSLDPTKIQAAFANKRELVMLNLHFIPVAVHHHSCQEQAITVRSLLLPFIVLLLFFRSETVSPSYCRTVTMRSISNLTFSLLWL